MTSLITCCYFLFLALVGGCFCSAKVVRPDYERSDQAGGWLKYHAEPAAWEEARLSCHAEGAILASPLTEKLRSAIETFAQKKKATDDEELVIFIGVHSTFAEGVYSSVEGVPLSRLAVTWAVGEPDNYNNTERCLAMSVDYFSTTADTRCDRVLPYVCYIKDTGKKFRFDYEWSEQAGGWLKYHVVPTTWSKAKPLCQAEGAVLASPITKQLEAAIVTFVHNQENFNEQGLTIFTGYERSYDGKPSFIDEDVLIQLETYIEDEEPSYKVKRQQTSGQCVAMTIEYNGTLANTSCDRVLPFVCYKKDTSLTISACGTTDPEYVLEPRTGSCYKFHGKGLPWSEAYMTCAAEGGYLAIVNDDVEARVVKEIYSKHPSRTITAYWTESLNVGFHDWGHYGTNYMTIHGESIDAHLWAAGEPNNYTNTRFGDYTESCGAVSRDAELNDHLCNGPTAFLCEKNPHSLLDGFEV